DQHRDVLLPVQSAQGRSHTARSWHEAARASDATELGACGRDSHFAQVCARRVARLSVLDGRARYEPLHELMRICFVCMGNICRSATGDAVMHKLVDDAGLADKITIDSAGTGGWHVGELPDPRSCAAGAKRGYKLTHRARKLVAGDFDRFDLVLAMDRENFE